MLIEEMMPSGMRVWHTRPDTDEPRGVLMLLHERYGPVQHSFNLIEKAAADGFVGVMQDLFHRYEGDRGPIERAEARVDCTDEESIADIEETLAYLRSLPYVDESRIGIAGFCLSGRIPIVFAAARQDAAAISITHGGIYPRDYGGEKDGQAKVSRLIPKVACPVLGMFGEADPSVPLENISRFRRELERNRMNYWVRVYAGTPHAWMNTTEPHRYREHQSDDAWRVLTEFFEAAFDGEWSGEYHRWRFEPDTDVEYDFAI